MGVRLADLPAIEPGRVLELKKDAEELQVREGLRRCKALAIIAQREGFPSWERLIARAGGSDAVSEAKPPTEADIRRAQRQAERLRRYGGGGQS